MRTLLGIHFRAPLAAALLSIPASSGAKTAETEGVPCRMGPGQAMQTCEFTVDRKGPTATVLVEFPNGFGRSLRFERGTFTGANPTMSGTGRKFDWSLSDGVHVILVDGQRFEIPDTAISGD